ncbi:MAG: hypothetical protein FJX75_05660, partial [Armatimonadetes bacterium]|nr:hypothetical protein [Armatimonadota bacterium]
MAHKLKIVAGIVIAIVAAVIVVWKLQPDRRSDSQQILERLVAIQDAVEEKSVGGVMQHVSESYKDSTCENKRELIRLAQSGFYEKGEIHCQLQVGRPDIRGRTATVDVNVDFNIDRNGQVATVKPFVVHTDWVRERKGWKLLRAE